MPFSEEINKALEKYNQSRSIFPWRNHDHLAIRDIKKLSDVDQGNIFKILKCFYDHEIKKDDPAYSVFMVAKKLIQNNIREALIYLSNSKLFTQENFDALKNHKTPSSIVLSLGPLEKSKLLTQENLNTLLTHQNSWAVSYSTILLEKANLLTQENFSSICQHKNPWNMAKALLILTQAPNKYFNFTQENVTKIIEFHSLYPSSFKSSCVAEMIATSFCSDIEKIKIKRNSNQEGISVVLLLMAGMAFSAQEIKVSIKEHDDPWKVAAGVEFLIRVDLLTKENFDLIKTHKKPRSFAIAIEALSKNSILITEKKEAIKKSIRDHKNPKHPKYITKISKSSDKSHLLNNLPIHDFNCLITHPYNIDYLTELFQLLDQSNLLTNENKDHLFMCEYPPYLLGRMKCLSEVGLLTQGNFYKSSAIGENYENTTRALINLKENNLLIQENFDLIIDIEESHFNIFVTLNVLISLSNSNLLTTENRKKLKILSQLEVLKLCEFSKIIKFLLKNKFLTQCNFDLLFEARNQEISKIKIVFDMAKCKGYLTEKYTTYIIRSFCSSFLRFLHIVKDSNIFDYLKKNNLLTSENEEVLLEIECQQSRWNFVEVLECMSKAGILTTENRQIIKKHHDSRSIAKVLVLLAEANLLTPENKNFATLHKKTHLLLRMLDPLVRNKLLTQETLNALKTTDQDPFIIMYAFETLKKVKLLTENNVNELLKPTNAVLLSRLAYDEIWRDSRFIQILTQRFFDLMIRCVRDAKLFFMINCKNKDNISNEAMLNQMGIMLEKPLFQSHGIDEMREVKEAIKFIILENLSLFHTNIRDILGYKNYCDQILENSNRFFTMRNFSEHRHDNPDAQRAYDKRFGLIVKKDSFIPSR